MLGEGAPENKNLQDFFFDKKMAVILHLLLFKINLRGVRVTAIVTISRLFYKGYKRLGRWICST